MIDNQTLDELTNKLSGLLPDGIKMMQDDIQKNIRAILESTLSNMHLVSREEFDVQTALLARTNEKLQKLEEQLQQLGNKNENN
jgi:ubiquinone biosynthesis accessory factor UbiK